MYTYFCVFILVFPTINHNQGGIFTTINPLVEVWAVAENQVPWVINMNF